VKNIFVPMKKSSAKSKFAKKGDDSSDTCSDIMPFKSNLPLVGNIVLESSLPPSAYPFQQAPYCRQV